MNRFAYIRPQTLAQAASAASTTVAEAMARPADAHAPATATAGAVIIKAGGIDVLDLMKENLLAPSAVVNLADVGGLDVIEEEADGGLRIGSMATLGGVGAHPLVAKRYPALSAALNRSASPQIRHLATIGGNLLQRPRCWYFRAEAFHCARKGGSHCFAIYGENPYHAIFDNTECAMVHPSTAATVLVALGSEVELADGHGGIRRISLEDFFVSPAQSIQRENDLKPHEILAAIRLPRLPASARMAYLKQGEKDSFDWPLADVAVVLDFAQGRACARASIVLGAAAPVPHRARAAEQALTGRHVDEDVATHAAQAALAGATPLSGNAYKVPLFETLIRRAVLAAAAH